jgi:AraC family transcriptional regulator of adaptative response / DNA-3-methyladenine glycosylase II
MPAAVLLQKRRVSASPPPQPQRAAPPHQPCGLSAAELYRALLSRDRRFDGRFFVAVSSTRIYCRPICTVRPPQFKNVTFHPSAASAEAAGYRPCLRCRPELAPGTIAAVDAVSRLATLAIRRIEDGALNERGLENLAAEFEVTSRHLRRAIHQEAGVSPVVLAQTQRLLLAKQLLTDTTMSVTEVALAAGFESLRRFNVAIKQHYRLTPTDIRRSARANKRTGNDAYQFQIAVRPPLDLAMPRAFWQARAIPGVEHVAEGVYRRTVQIGVHRGWILLGPSDQPHHVRLTVSQQLGPVLPTILARAKTMLDVRADPVAIADRFSGDALLAPLMQRFPATRIPGAFDSFECSVRTIVGQQISVRAASTIAGRLAARFGSPCETPFAELTTIFPSAATLASAKPTDLQSIGLTARRAITLQSFAAAVANGQLRLDPGADPGRTRAALVAMPGIGDWTAEYVLMRGSLWPDAFPASDLGLLKATGLTPRALQARANDWRPWRSYAAILLWQSLKLKEANPIVGGESLRRLNC